MGAGEDFFKRWKERAICDANRLCSAERTAKERGRWFFQIDFLGFKREMSGGKPGTEAVSGAFEIYKFAPTFKELDVFDDEDDYQPRWKASAIYTTLDLIKTGEAMAFLKKPDEFSVPLADARREHRSFNHFKFNLRKFSPSGGVLYKFDLEMQGVFLLDIEPAGDFEKVLITYSNTTFGAELPDESEESALRRVMRGR